MLVEGPQLQLSVGLVHLRRKPAVPEPLPISRQHDDHALLVHRLDGQVRRDRFERLRQRGALQQHDLRVHRFSADRVRWKVGVDDGDCL